MNILNKLFANPLIVAIMITLLVILVTIIPTIYCKKAYKFQSYICSLLFLLLAITIILVLHGTSKDCKFTGASEAHDFSNIFSTPTQFNTF